jgi:hypothetical protein
VTIDEIGRGCECFPSAGSCLDHERDHPVVF